MTNRIVGSVVRKARGIWINRKYKDRLFRVVFQDKNDLLSLYNAINGTEYTNCNDLIIKTLDDAVYLGFKNDLSFLISNTLNLYEHQSTVNPNMPLRGLIYFTDMLKAYIDENGYNIYGPRLVPLPIPQYIVFYNGAEDLPDVTELRLSDAFGMREAGKASLECKAVMLNINLGHNLELMEKCERLGEYAYFVAAVLKYRNTGYGLEDAIDYAIEECIEKNMISDVLAKNRSEVMNLLLTDFSERKYRKMLRKEAWEEGKEEGRAEGREEGKEEGREEGREEGKLEGEEKINRLNRHLLADDRLADLQRSLSDREYQIQLLKEYRID